MARKRKTPTKRRAATRRRRNAAISNTAVRYVVGAVAGGASGALLGGLAVRAGLSPQTAGLGLTGTGVAVGLLGSGTTRYVGAGMAAAGAGQLSLGWFAKQSAKQDGKPRQGLPPGGETVEEAFERARNRLELGDDLELDDLIEINEDGELVAA